VTRALADEVLRRCDVLAGFSEEPGRLSRLFLCPAMRHVHDALRGWMQTVGMSVRRDAIGNLIGHYPARRDDAPVFLIGSHLDTVPDAGKYDGILGVLLGVAAVQALGGQRLPFAIEVIGFSEEEGVRFRSSYLGSKALCGRVEPALLERVDAAGISVASALRDFGLDPSQIDAAAYSREKRLLGYLEAHIEQGPVLDSRGLPLGVVEAIVGQSRHWLCYDGKAGHAGTTPMELRRDALAAAAEFVLAGERRARAVEGLRATVGAIAVTPNAVNVIPGGARLSLDLRHADDAVRDQSGAALLEEAAQIGKRRGVACHVDTSEHSPATPADRRLTDLLAGVLESRGHVPLRMVSGAGHDAAIMASLAPMTMLFLRSPGGISHHPDEAVHADDVHAALEVMIAFLQRLAGEQG
jgi:allantoate deiminase